MRAQVSLELIVLISGMIVIAAGSYFLFKSFVTNKQVPEINESSSSIIDTMQNWSGQNGT
jgi:uncharacterized protein (UPF0333 family)